MVRSLPVRMMVNPPKSFVQNSLQDLVGLFPAIFRTCRQINKECEEVLYGDTPFSMVCAPSLWLTSTGETRRRQTQRGERVCPLLRHVQDDPIFYLSDLPVLSKVQNWRVIVSPFKNGNRDPVEDFKMFCRSISVSRPLKSLEITIILTSVDRMAWDRRNEAGERARWKL